MKTRDYYAAAALVGMMTDYPGNKGRKKETVVAEACDLADALIAEACRRWGHDYEEEPRRNEMDVPLRRWCRRCDHQQHREQDLAPTGDHCEWKDGAP